MNSNEGELVGNNKFGIHPRYFTEAQRRELFEDLKQAMRRGPGDFWDQTEEPPARKMIEDDDE
jgi:hypothetical protein